MRETLLVFHEVRADDGAALWCQVTGHGPPVVLCHGGPGICSDYLEPFEQMLAAVATVCRWDQRGSGRSAHAGPYSTDRFAADLECVAAAQGWPRFAVVGHSWGANLAIAYAQAYPDRVTGVLYVCGTGLEWWPTFSTAHKVEQLTRLRPEEREEYVALLAGALSPDQERRRQLLYLRTDFGSIEAADRYAAVVCEQENRYAVNPAANAAINAETKAAAPAVQVERCAGIAAPVVIVDAVNDPRPVAACDSLAAALPDSRRRSVSSGHFPWWETPDELARIVREFVDQMQPAAEARAP